MRAPALAASSLAALAIFSRVAVAGPAPTPEARAKEVVQRWVDAQNKGDFAAYSALYAPSFHGLRQSQGQRVAVDRDAWLRDHARFFKKKIVVKVDSLAVSGAPTMRIDLVETFATDRYEDRGKKRLQLVDRDGQLLIDYEELLQSLSPEGPSTLKKCNQTKLGAGGGDVVLESCVAGQIRVEKGPTGVNKKWKTTLTHGVDSVALAELASGWEWDDSWRLLGVLTSDSKDREQAVVLQRVREDIGDDAAWESSVEIRALVHDVPTIWSTHDTLVGAQVSIESDHVTITARHVPTGTHVDAYDGQAHEERTFGHQARLQEGQDRRSQVTPCPCGGAEQETCCGPFLDGKTKPETPEQLMRSRYTAYALRRPLYLRETWHPRTRPRFIELGTTAWLGLTIVHSGTQDDSHGTVEFVARYRERGQVHELREHSRFEKLRGGWLYVDALD